MKNLKKIGLALAAFILTFGLVLGMSAFKDNPKKTTMYYILDSDQEIDVPFDTNWDHIDEQDVPTASCDGEDLSCIIRYDTGDFASLQQLLDTYPSSSLLKANGHVVSEKNPGPSANNK